MEDVPRTTDDSWRVLREAFADRRKYVAHAVRRANSQVDRWVVPPPSPGNPDSSGDINPLDFMISVFRACERENARQALDWLCGQFGGRFVPQDGGQGDGRLFRELEEALPHLKALQKELARNCINPPPGVVAAHLEEAYVIITSWLMDPKEKKR